MLDKELNSLRLAMDLKSFMPGLEDSDMDPQDVNILAQEIEATNSTKYDDYDDDHKVEQPADGINIMKLIETSVARYNANMQEEGHGIKPYFNAQSLIDSPNPYVSMDKYTQLILTAFAKNKNDVEQSLDTEVLKEYNKLILLLKNKAKCKKLIGTKNDPFLLEGIVSTYNLFTMMLLAYVPMKIQTGKTLSAMITEKTGTAFFKIFDVVKYINSIQSKLGTKIYYKPPLVSEITGKTIDTVKDTKFDFRRHDQDREDSGLRDYNREVIVTASTESYDEGTEGLFSWVKDKFSRNKKFKSNLTMDEYKHSVEVFFSNHAKLLKEMLKPYSDIVKKYEITIEASKWDNEDYVDASLMIQFLKSLNFVDEGNDERAKEVAKILGCYPSKDNIFSDKITKNFKEQFGFDCEEDGDTDALSFSSPDLTSIQFTDSVPNSGNESEMYDMFDYDSYISNYHYSCESIENMIEIRNNNVLLEYSKLIRALAFTTTIARDINYQAQSMQVEIERLFKDTTNAVVTAINALIAKFDVHILSPINISYRKYTEREEGRDIKSDQFVSKEFDTSLQGRAYLASRPKVEDFED